MERVAEIPKQHDHGSPAACQAPGVATAAAPLSPFQELQQQAGNQAIQQLLRSRVLQPKLAISNPDDPEEREADNVAHMIMRSHAGAPASSPSSCSGNSEMCEECQQIQTKPTISRSASATAAPAHVPQIVSDVLRSPGHPLDSASRAFFEPRLGHDFSHVRVHTDMSAADSAKAVQARAYTVGRDIVFGTGEFSPGSESGLRLLSHELTHTIQQLPHRSGMALQRHPDDKPPKPMEPLEAIAQRIARLTLGPKQAKVQSRVGSPRGPVLSVVRNKNTGEIFVGLNTGTPQQQTDAIKRGIEAQKERIARGEIRVIHDVTPGEHSEVNALNSAIAAEEKRINRSLKDEELSMFELHNVWLTEDKQLETAPRCEHCAAISQYVSVTESLAWAESGGSVTPSGGKAQPVKTTAAGETKGSQPGPATPPGAAPEPERSSKTQPTGSQSPPRTPADTASPTHEKTTEAKDEPKVFEGMPEVEIPHEGGPSAKGEALGGGVVVGAQLKDWIMGKLGEKAQSQRLNAVLARRSKYIASVQKEHPEFGVLIKFYWRVYRGNEGEESRVFEDLSIRTGRTQKEAQAAPEGMLNLTASPSDAETNETWLPPLEPVPLLDYPTPYEKIAIATFASWRWAVLQDVSWGGPWGGAFNKKAKTKLDIPQNAHPKFAILSPPKWINVQGYGRVDIETRSAPTSDGYVVPVISDLNAALVFPLDAETAKLLTQGPAIKDTTYQLQGDFDLTRWVPAEDIEIESSSSKEVSQTVEGQLWNAVKQGMSAAVIQHPLASPSGSTQRSRPEEDVLRFSKSGEKVTEASLVTWARENYPRGLDDPRLLKNIYASHEFRGSDSAREAAAVALVLKLREEASKAHSSK